MVMLKLQNLKQMISQSEIHDEKVLGDLKV